MTQNADAVLGTWKLRSYEREKPRPGEGTISSVRIRTAISAMRRTAGCTRFSSGRTASAPRDVVPT